MQSVAFIREVANVIREIDDFELAKSLGVDSNPDTGPNLQKRVSSLLGSLQNPSLPSAYKLKNKALEVGMFVDNGVIQRIAQFEFM
jgi:hypothetical protein